MLLQRARLPTLYNGRLQAIVVLMYKVKKGLSCALYNLMFSNLFVRNASEHSHRNNDFIIPRFDTTRYG